MFEPAVLDPVVDALTGLVGRASPELAIGTSRPSPWRPAVPAHRAGPMVSTRDPPSVAMRRRGDARPRDLPSSTPAHSGEQVVRPRAARRRPEVGSSRGRLTAAGLTRTSSTSSRGRPECPAQRRRFDRHRRTLDPRRRLGGRPTRAASRGLERRAVADPHAGRRPRVCPATRGRPAAPSGGSRQRVAQHGARPAVRRRTPSLGGPACARRAGRERAGEPHDPATTARGCSPLPARGRSRWTPLTASVRRAARAAAAALSIHARA